MWVIASCCKNGIEVTNSICEDRGSRVLWGMACSHLSYWTRQKTDLQVGL